MYIMNCKTSLFLFLFLCMAEAVCSQTKSTATFQPADSIDRQITLDGVEVRGAKIVNTIKGQNIYPTANQLRHSSDGYALLARLALPGIMVKPQEHTVSVPDVYGAVQLRINDVIATEQDLLAIDMKSVKYVEYIKNPGVRYGDGVGIVINFVVKRAVSGYACGVNLTQFVTAKSGNHNVYGRWNFGKSELDVDYTAKHNHFNGYNEKNSTDYLLADGTNYHKESNTISSSMSATTNNVRLRYSLADSSRYVFQSTLQGFFENSPHDRIINKLFVADKTDETYKLTHDRTSSPSIDLYTHVSLGAHENITANLVGTRIDSRYAYRCSELGKVYSYSVDGMAHSLSGEAVYENTLKPFTFSSGVQYFQKYAENVYLGDVATTTREHISNVYFFSQLAGKLSRLRYQLGLGFSRQYYSQSAHHYNQWMFRPKLLLSYPLGNFNFRYTADFTQNPSRVAQLSDVAIQTDEMTINAGNPNLKTVKRIEQTFDASYQSPRLYSTIVMFYRSNMRPNMEEIIREKDKFVFTQSNQRRINVLVVSNDTRYDIIPDKLSLRLYGCLLRCFNYGNDYKHHFSSFNFSADLTAYLGPFSLTAYADNGWRFLEGEHKGCQSAPYSYLSATYNKGAFSVSLTASYLFSGNTLRDRSELLNRYVHSRFEARNSDYANLVSLDFAFRLDGGRKYQRINRRMNNQDNDSGILK